jgi:hypothetical protein
LDAIRRNVDQRRHAEARHHRVRQCGAHQELPEMPTAAMFRRATARTARVSRLTWHGISLRHVIRHGMSFGMAALVLQRSIVGRSGDARVRANSVS